MRASRGHGASLIGLVFFACSGATDPNPAPGASDAGASSSSSSGDVAPRSEAGTKATGPSNTPGKVACGASSCAAPSVCCTDGAAAECKGSADDCTHETISCDEDADCAQGHCCAEESTQTAMRFSTYCRPTCITNLPRVQVCVSAAEECTKCKEYSCGGFEMKGVKTCAPLGACD